MIQINDKWYAVHKKDDNNNNFVYCNGCGKSLFSTPDKGYHGSKTFKDYKNGKYKYCPKCGYRITEIE